MHLITVLNTNIHTQMQQLCMRKRFSYYYQQQQTLRKLWHKLYFPIIYSTYRNNNNNNNNNSNNNNNDNHNSLNSFSNPASPRHTNMSSPTRVLSTTNDDSNISGISGNGSFIVKYESNNSDSSCFNRSNFRFENSNLLNYLNVVTSNPRDSNHVLDFANNF